MAQTTSWNRVRQRATELRAGRNRIIIPRTYSGGHSAWWRPLAIAAAVVCAVMPAEAEPLSPPRTASPIARFIA